MGFGKNCMELGMLGYNAGARVPRVHNSKKSPAIQYFKTKSHSVYLFYRNDDPK